MYPPLFSLNNQVDVPSTWIDPQEMYPLLFSVTTTQVDVPSTCTTKDVPSNVLRQRILRRLVLWIFVRGNKRYLRWLVLWNLLFKGKGRIKRILRQLILWILLEREKGDTKEFWRLILHYFGKGIRDTQKDFRRLVLVEFFLAKGEENERWVGKNCKGLKVSQKLFKKLFKKENWMQVKVLLW